MLEMDYVYEIIFSDWIGVVCMSDLVIIRLIITRCGCVNFFWAKTVSVIVSVYWSVCVCDAVCVCVCVCMCLCLCLCLCLRVLVCV